MQGGQEATEDPVGVRTSRGRRRSEELLVCCFCCLVKKDKMIYIHYYKHIHTYAGGYECILSHIHTCINIDIHAYIQTDRRSPSHLSLSFPPLLSSSLNDLPMFPLPSTSLRFPPLPSFLLAPPPPLPPLPSPKLTFPPAPPHPSPFFSFPLPLRLSSHLSFLPFLSCPFLPS